MRTKFFFILAFGLGTGIGAGVATANSMVLEPSLELGTEYVVKTENNVRMALPIGGAAGEQTVKTEYQARVKVTPHKDRKSKVVSVVFEYAKIEITSPMMRAAYDSRETDSNRSVLGAGYENLIGKEIRAIYDEHDQFVAFSGTDYFEEGGQSSPFAQEIGPHQVRELIEATAGMPLGRRSVRTGQTWEESRVLPLPGVGDMELATKYIYRKDGVIGGESCAVIDFSGALLEELFADEGGVSDDGNITQERRADDGIERVRMEGMVAIDKKSGLARASQMEMRMVMKMPSPLDADDPVEIPMLLKAKTSLVSFRHINSAEMQQAMPVSSGAPPSALNSASPVTTP